MIQIYTTTYCPYCARAKDLLDKKGVHYQEISVENDSALRQAMEQRSGRKTVPQIFIGDYHVGGCDDLYALEESGKLNKLLATEK
jgi:glutaredoxin 3